MDFHEFLQTIPDFTELTNEQISILEQSMLVSTHPDGYKFFDENTRSDNIYLIVEGTVSVTHNRGKKVGFIEIKRHQPGEWFGVISIIDNSKHAATCQAIGNVTVASLPALAFLLLYESDAPLAHKIHYSINKQILKDYRELVQVVRNVLFTIDKGKDYKPILRDSILKYDGPERRVTK